MIVCVWWPRAKKETFCFCANKKRKRKKRGESQEIIRYKLASSIFSFSCERRRVVCVSVFFLKTPHTTSVFLNGYLLVSVSWRTFEFSQKWEKRNRTEKKNSRFFLFVFWKTRWTWLWFVFVLKKRKKWAGVVWQ